MASPTKEEIARLKAEEERKNAQDEQQNADARAEIQAAQTADQVREQKRQERAREDESVAQHNAAVLRGATGAVVDPNPNFTGSSNVSLEEATADQLELRLKALRGEQDKNAPRCGQPNAHWTGEGKMVCVLAKGHVGAHQAHYERAGVKNQVTNWRDDAVTPVPEFTPA